MGRFNMGSTVILLYGNKKMEWDKNLKAEMAVQLGNVIGTIK